jgi:biotin synthase
MQTQLSVLFNEKGQLLFKKAQEVTAGLPSVFTTPIVYTTICATKPPCHHCFWRSQSFINPDFWRKTEKVEAANRALKAAQYGVQRILVPSGCIGSDLPKAYYEHVSLVKEMASGVNPDIEIFGICGPLSKESLKTLKSLGMDGYSCSLEIPNPDLFKKIRPGDDFDARVQTVKDTAEVGLKVWSGFMFGLGESKQDLMNGIRLLKQFDIDSLSLSPYEQYPYIELQRRSTANMYDWAKLLAIGRLHFGDVNIYTRAEHANWGYRGGANAIVPIIIKETETPNALLTVKDCGVKQTDELERLRKATYAVKK